jgi:hypothetical protein
VFSWLRPRRLTSPAAAIFAVFAAATTSSVTPDASAQVNIEALRGELPRHGLGGRLSGSIAGYGGNTRGVIMGGNFLVGAYQSRHRSFVTGTLDFAHLGQETQVAKAMGHARYAFALNKTWALEAFGQIEADRFRELRLRELVGLGPRLEWTGTCAELTYGTAYMLEYVRRDQQSARQRDNTDVQHRFSHYARGAFHAGERVLLASTVYYQPRFDAFSDFRVLTVATLEFKVTELLRSRIDATVRYESVVPSGVERYDVEIKNAIGVKF